MSCLRLYEINLSFQAKSAAASESTAKQQPKSPGGVLELEDEGVDDGRTDGCGGASCMIRVGKIVSRAGRELAVIKDVGPGAQAWRGYKS